MRADEAEKEGKRHEAGLNQTLSKLTTTEHRLQMLEEQLKAKAVQLERIENDIDRLRNLRDMERKEFGDGLGHR